MNSLLFIFFLLGTISCATKNEKVVWNYLKNKGLTDAGAGGLMGNLQAESNMRSVVYENIYKSSFGFTDQDYVDMVNNGTYTKFVDDGVGFGLAQWTFSTRKQALYDLCEGKIGDLRCQLDFLMIELENDFADILVMLKTSTDLYACTIKVMTDFERSGDYSEALKKFRYDLAKSIYNEFSGSPIEDIDDPKGKTYKIEPGDTLLGIAEKFGVTVEEICELNDIEDPNMIYAGQVIYIPEKSLNN